MSSLQGVRVGRAGLVPG